MAVIINEFEVIPDTSESTEETTNDTSPELDAGSRLAPMDMYDVLQHQMDRILRTWAH